MPSSPRSEPKLTARSSTRALHRAVHHPLHRARVLLQHEHVAGAEEGHRRGQVQALGNRPDIEPGVEHDEVRSTGRRSATPPRPPRRARPWPAARTSGGASAWSSSLPPRARARSNSYERNGEMRLRIAGHGRAATADGDVLPSPYGGPNDRRHLRLGTADLQGGRREGASTRAARRRLSCSPSFTSSTSTWPHPMSLAGSRPIGWHRRCAVASVSPAPSSDRPRLRASLSARAGVSAVAGGLPRQPRVRGQREIGRSGLDIGVREERHVVDGCTVCSPHVR